MGSDDGIFPVEQYLAALDHPHEPSPAFAARLEIRLLTTLGPVAPPDLLEQENGATPLPTPSA